MTVPLQLLDEGARRLALLAAVLAVTFIALQLFQRLAQPQLAPILDDPIVRLAALAAILMAAALVALHRYHVVTSRALLSIGMVFEVLVAFAIAMVETSRPFAPDAPLLGLSAISAWILLMTAVVPTPPRARVVLALAVATTWPVAYWINSVRFDFVTESWRQTSIWPAMNYLIAGLTYMLGRATYAVAEEAGT